VEIIRAEINAINYNNGPTSVLYKKTPEFILEVAFQEGYCILKLGPTGLGIIYLFTLYILW